MKDSPAQPPELASSQGMGSGGCALLEPPSRTEPPPLPGPEVRVRPQQWLAAGAALFFLAIAIWVAWETRENVLFLSKRIRHAAQEREEAIAALIAKQQGELEQLKAEGIQHREAIRREVEASVLREENKRDGALREIETALNGATEKERGAFSAEYDHRLSVNEGAVEEKRKKQAEVIAELQSALATVEGSLTNATVAKNLKQSFLNTIQLRRDADERTKAQAQKELEALRVQARSRGYDIDAAGNLIAPNGSPLNPFNWPSWWRYYKDTLESEWDRNTRLIRTCSNSIQGLEKEISKASRELGELEAWLVTGEKKLSERRTDLERTRTRFEGEIGSLQRRLGDDLRDWKKQAEGDLNRSINNLRTDADLKRNAKRERAQADIEALWQDETARQKEAVKLETELRDKRLVAQKKAMKELEELYDTKFKDWQKSRGLRALVGLLHTATGLYALILAGRCVVRWLQFKGLCAQRSLVAIRSK